MILTTKQSTKHVIVTDEALRTAIAEACGWWHDGGSLWYNKTATLAVLEQDLPDYLNDLNAMHEAVMSQKDVPGFMKKYNHMLAISCVVSGSRVRTSAEEFVIINATAAQRAEAFGRTLWPEKF